MPTAVGAAVDAVTVTLGRTAVVSGFSQLRSQLSSSMRYCYVHCTYKDMREASSFKASIRAY